MRQTEIPAAMEDFGSVDRAALEYIKAVIDQCDYYVLIIAGRYGSIDESGLSYTEQEYDYALEKSKTILVFIRRDISNIPAKDVDTDKNLRKQLERFRSKASKGRLVSFWDDPKTLITDVTIALGNAFRTHPGLGWVRATQFDKVESVEIERLKYENQFLRAELEEMKSVVNAQEFDFESLLSIFRINVDYYVNLRSWSEFIEISWAEIFSIVGPIMKSHSEIEIIRGKMSSVISTALRKSQNAFEGAEINDLSFDEITSYFIRCNFIEMKNDHIMF